MDLIKNTARVVNQALRNPYETYFAVLNEFFSWSSSCQQNFWVRPPGLLLDDESAELTSSFSCNSAHPSRSSLSQRGQEHLKVLLPNSTLSQTSSHAYYYHRFGGQWLQPASLQSNDPPWEMQSSILSGSLAAVWALWAEAAFLAWVAPLWLLHCGRKVRPVFYNWPSECWCTYYCGVDVQ